LTFAVSYKSIFRGVTLSANSAIRDPAKADHEGAKARVASLSLNSQSRLAALDNGWGLRGWTRAVLAALTKDELSAALALASARAKPAAR